MAEEGQSVAHRGMVPSGRSSSSGVIPKVISSVHTLLANRSWAEITVLDICNEAEISVSSLYARFSHKDVIIEVVQSEFLDWLLAECQQRAAQLVASEDSLEVAARGLVELVVCTLSDNRYLLRTCLESPELTRRRQVEFDLPALKLGAELVMKYRPDLEPQVATRQFELLGRTVLSGAMRWFLPPAERIDGGSIVSSELVDLLASIVVQFISADLAEPG